MLAPTHGFLHPSPLPCLLLAVAQGHHEPSACTMFQLPARVRPGRLHPMLGVVLVVICVCLTGTSASLDTPVDAGGHRGGQASLQSHLRSVRPELMGGPPQAQQRPLSPNFLNIRNAGLASDSGNDAHVENSEVKGSQDTKYKSKGEYDWMGFSEKFKLENGEGDKGKTIGDVKQDDFLKTGIDLGIYKSKRDTVLNIDKNIPSEASAKSAKTTREDVFQDLDSKDTTLSSDVLFDKVDVDQLLPDDESSYQHKVEESEEADLHTDIILSLQNDTHSLRELIQKTVEKILDSLESQLLKDEEESPQTFEAESEFLSHLDDPDAGESNELEEMLKNERVSGLQQRIEASYEHVLKVLLEATASQTVPENLDLWRQKVADILADTNYPSRTKRSYKQLRRSYRRRQRMRRLRMRMRQHIARQLAINYGHVSPCGYKDRYYCMNGGTCVIIGDLDIKTCRCPIGFTNTRCQQIDQEYILSLLGTALVFS